MRNTILSIGALIALAGAAQAASYVNSLGTVNVPVNTGVNNSSQSDWVFSTPQNVTTGTTDLVRGFYITGAYSATDQTTPDVATYLRAKVTSASMGTPTLGRHMGGLQSSSGPSNWTFAGGANATWNGNSTTANATTSPVNQSVNGELATNSHVAGNTADLAVSFAGDNIWDPSGGTLSSANAVLLTDVIAPISGSLVRTGTPDPTTTSRLQSLSTLTSGSGTYRYKTQQFTIPATETAGNTYLVMLSSSFDAYLQLYATSGVVTPQTTTNVVGVDADLAGNAGSTAGSAMFVTLTPGATYTAVITTQASGSTISGNWTLYVAGGNSIAVPTPGAAALAGLGALAAARRRRA